MNKPKMYILFWLCSKKSFRLVDMESQLGRNKLQAMSCLLLCVCVCVCVILKMLCC